jgi:hypothetical protein
MESAHAELMKQTLSTNDDEIKWFQDREAEARRARELEERYLPFEQPRVCELSHTHTFMASGRLMGNPGTSATDSVRRRTHAGGAWSTGAAAGAAEEGEVCDGASGRRRRVERARVASDCQDSRCGGASSLCVCEESCHAAADGVSERR